MEFVRRVQKEKLVKHFLSPPAVERRRKLREEQKKASWYVEEIDGDDAPERPVPPHERMALRPDSYRSDLPETGLVELYRDISADSIREQHCEPETRYSTPTLVTYCPTSQI